MPLLAKTHLHFLKDCVLEILSLVSETHRYCHCKIYVDLVINIKAKRKGGGGYDLAWGVHIETAWQEMAFWFIPPPQYLIRLRVCFINDHNAIQCSFQAFFLPFSVTHSWYASFHVPFILCYMNLQPTPSLGIKTVVSDIWSLIRLERIFHIHSFIAPEFCFVLCSSFLILL